MSLFSKMKLSIKDWVSGNSINFEIEESVYKDIMNLLENLELNLDAIIAKGTLADEWAIIKFQDNIYTLPLLKILIKKTLQKSQNCTISEMNNLLSYAVELQEIFEKYEKTVKKRIIKHCAYYSEFQEIYYILVELKKILVSHMNLETIKSCYSNVEDLPNYNDIIKLKIKITQRRTIILPYLSEIDYNKGRSIGG